MIPKMVPDFETFDSHEIKSLNILRVKRFFCSNSKFAPNGFMATIW